MRPALGHVPGFATTGEVVTVGGGYVVQVLTSSGWQWVTDPVTGDTDPCAALAVVFNDIEGAREARLDQLFRCRCAFVCQAPCVVFVPWRSRA